MRTFDALERRARLAVRHHLSPAYRAADVLGATDGVVCLHATDPATVYLSAWARVDGLARAEVDRALYTDRSLVKHLCMRRTLFVLRRELLPVVQAAASRRVADQEERRLAKDVERAGLAPDGARWLKEAQEAALAALASRGEATSTQLRQAHPHLDATIVYAPEKPYGGDVPLAPRVLTTLSAGGRIVRASNQGGWSVSRPAWARTADWLGEDPPALPEREARAELVRRWLRSFGPATAEDVKWWLGSTVTAVRQALGDVGAVEVDLAGRPGVVLPDDLDPVEPVEPYAALLPQPRPDADGLVREGLVSRPPSVGGVRRQRQRRSHGVVGRPGGGGLASDRLRGRRAPPAGGRRHRGRGGAGRRGRPAHRLVGRRPRRRPIPVAPGEVPPPGSLSVTGRPRPRSAVPFPAWTSSSGSTSTSPAILTASRWCSPTVSAATRTCGVSSPRLRGRFPGRPVRPRRCWRARTGGLRPGALRDARGVRRGRRSRSAASSNSSDVIFVGHSVSAHDRRAGRHRGARAASPSSCSSGPSPRYIDDEAYVGGFAEDDIDGAARLARQQLPRVVERDGAGDHGQPRPARAGRRSSPPASAAPILRSPAGSPA